MDLLYSRYASPSEFMRLYIEDGRFGEWVGQIISLENKRKKEQAEAENDRMLWEAYIRSGSDKTFGEYKEFLLQPQEGKKQAQMSHAEIKAVVDDSRNILLGFVPEEEG